MTLFVGQAVTQAWNRQAVSNALLGVQEMKQAHNKQACAAYAARVQGSFVMHRAKCKLCCSRCTKSQVSGQ